MRAIRFDLTIPRYLLGRSLGKVADWAVFGAPSGLALTEVPDPALPGPAWVRLEVLMCGICGSDVGALTFKNSPAMEPFASFPAVLGHEVLARVLETGKDVTRVRVGDRVAVDPGISCTVRGRADDARCPPCASGFPATCHVSGDAGGPSPTGAPLARGGIVGYHRDLPGGWGERMVVHESQLHPVADELDDRTAVLIEPLSIGVHAALRALQDKAAPALVIGSGPIAMGAIWALRSVGHTGPLVAQVKRPHEAALALELGVSVTAAPGDAAKEALQRVTGARPYRPLVGPEVWNGGGFPLIFDCVGTNESLDQALRFVAPRGRIALLGCAGVVRALDLTFLWAREVEMLGFLCYGRERWRGEEPHTFAITNRLLVETQAPVAKVVTHTFPVARYREALSAAAHHRESKAVKVVLTPR